MKVLLCFIKKIHLQENAEKHFCAILIFFCREELSGFHCIMLGNVHRLYDIVIFLYFSILIIYPLDIIFMELNKKMFRVHKNRISGTENFMIKKK